MSDAGTYFDPAYFEWQGARAEASARAIVPLLLEQVAARSAVDLGCGTGAWLQILAEHGADDVVGVDGPYIDRSQLRIPAERFVAADLASPPPLGRTFDLALSLEAAHYAPAEAAEAIVGWLAAHAPVVFFSAAVPHQPGGPGLNRQWPAYWSGLFEARGFRCHDTLRPRLWERPGADWWYAQNGLLFAREDASVAGPPTARPLALVHPELLALVAEEAERGPEPVAEPRRRRVLGRRGA
jgi:SAM-dependent methyltransferase